MKTVRTDAGTLNVRVDGPSNGPVVMFANSLGTDLRVWDDVMHHLPHGLRIVRYDKRGHGLSDCPPAPYDIAELVADAAAVADATHATDIAFVGLSIGGLIGQGLALERPDLVKSLVLMDTAVCIGTPDMWQDRISALRDGGLPGMTDAILDRWFCDALRNDPVALAPWRNMLERTPLEGYIGCCQAIAGADFRPRSADIKVPVMAIVGREDGATSPELMADTAQLFGAPLHVIEQAGHLPCVEKPTETAALIAAFLKETQHV